MVTGDEMGGWLLWVYRFVEQSDLAPPVGFIGNIMIIVRISVPHVHNGKLIVYGNAKYQVLDPGPARPARVRNAYHFS